MEKYKMSTVDKSKEQLTVFSVKDYNRHNIIQILKKYGPQRFKDLKEKTKHSPRGLNNMLKDLLRDKKIQKTFHKEHPAYSLTDTGNELSKDLDFLFEYRKKFIIDGGQYHENYSNQWGSMLFCDLPWGIVDGLVLDKNISSEINPITQETTRQIQEVLFRKLLSDVKDKKITLDDTKNGTIVLDFTIDYKELVKSLKSDSLRKYNNTIHEEFELYQKIEYETIQKWEYDLLKESREEKITKEQFRRKLKKLQKQHLKKEKIKG